MAEIETLEHLNHQAIQPTGKGWHTQAEMGCNLAGNWSESVKNHPKLHISSSIQTRYGHNMASYSLQIFIVVLLCKSIKVMGIIYNLMIDLFFCKFHH